MPRDRGANCASRQTIREIREQSNLRTPRVSLSSSFPSSLGQHARGLRSKQTAERCCMRSLSRVLLAGPASYYHQQLKGAP